jgi:serine/threonine-protein kinase
VASLVGRTFGPYRLIEQIGHGGMASVYKAYDTKQDREVALKVMFPSLADDPRFTKRFVREAKIVLQLKHPNIVPVWDFGAADGYFYLAMPYLKVGTLSDRLQRGPLGLQESARLVSQVCSALDLAHRQGVVHRDIKPSNILLDENGNALLTDFGLAQIQDATLSLTGSALLGTPAYVSPEQARGDSVDPHSDQYSLGIILFQLATGQLPFDAETPMAIVLKHVQEPLPLPRSINPRVPESVQRIILKATAKDPADRFASVADLNAAFQAALAHALDPRAPAPQVVVPPSAQVTSPLRTAPPQPEKRRSRTLVWVGSLALLLLLVPVIALAAPGILEIVRPVASAPAVLFVTPTGLAATIDALSTDLARPSSGDGMSGDQVATAVAGTLVAQGALPTDGPGFTFQFGQQTGTPTVTSIWLMGTSSPTRTPTPGGGPGGGGPGASATPTRTATPTPSPTELGAPTDPATDTPTPVPTPTRTNTPVPPTNTPGPPTPTNIPPGHCDGKHGNPTCTPQP